MAHRLTAGADILLMPSRFEPCGLNQLYAMAYGTVPVVHAVCARLVLLSSACRVLLLKRAMRTYMLRLPGRPTDVALPTRSKSDLPSCMQVGGLKDTVQPFNPENDSGTGWTFEWAQGEQLRHAVGNAVYTYKEYRESFRAIQRRGMSQDLSWDNAAQQYEEVLVAGKYQW